MSRLQANKSSSFNQFTDMVEALLNAAWGPDWGTFTEAYPNGTDPTNVKFPVITYMMKEKRPGIVGNGRTQEIKPRFRQDVIHDSDHNGPRVVNIYSQVFDHDVVFEIWEENNKKASEWAEKFEDFMRVYTGFFMQNGVKQIIFDHMNDNPETPKWKEDIVTRKFRYLVQLERHTVVPSDVIEKVTASVTPVSSLSDDSIDSHDSI